MDTNKSQVLDDLRTLEPCEFFSKHYFERCPFVFDTWRESAAWKYLMASKLKADSAELTIVGSATLGVSLKEYKIFEPFSNKSDIDVAIISHYHFSIAWRFLRQSNDLYTRLDYKEKSAWDDHRTRLIYWGTIAADRILARLPFGDEWFSVANDMSKIAPTEDRDIKFRIYADYDSLRQYQMLSINKARRRALAGQVS